MKNRKTTALAAGVAALAVAGGFAATFTNSTSAPAQKIGSGTLAITLDTVAPTTWTDDISNLAAGDSVTRYVNVRNSGTLKIASATLGQTNTLGSLLTAPSDISVKLEDCSVAWTAGTGVCSGTAITVLDATSLAAWTSGTKALAGFDALGAGESNYLKLTTSLAAGATNTVQNTKGAITYTFGASQRTATVDANGAKAPESAPAPAAKSFSATSVSGPSGSVQTYSIERTGTYAISASGAQGGSNNDWGTSVARGGLGARVGANFVLNQGDVIKVVVGQVGGSGGGGQAGGGGGTYVVNTTTNKVLAVAAGGGGGSGCSVTGNYSGSGAMNGGVGLSAEGTDSAVVGNGYAAAGAGYTFNGTSSGQFNASYSYLNGSAGGGGQTGGGFGGGGGVSGNCSGGGGGGYSGGTVNGTFGSGNGGSSHLDSSAASMVRQDGVQTSSGAASITWVN